MTLYSMGILALLNVQSGSQPRAFPRADLISPPASLHPSSRQSSADIQAWREVPASPSPLLPPLSREAFTTAKSFIPSLQHFFGEMSAHSRSGNDNLSDKVDRPAQALLGKQLPSISSLFGPSPSTRQLRLFYPSEVRSPITHPSDQGQVPTSGGEPKSSTSNNAAMSEGAPAQDVLGPKIWTGTQFLPRFVRAAEVAGEGMCFFYDDGTYCKTVIEGEAVNAHWGVTKAGRPRKRLAIACLTCREKKIKCDPDYPRCMQCEKFGRVCKFKNAPRGGHNSSPSSPSDDFGGQDRQSGMSARSSNEQLAEINESSAVSAWTAREYPSPELSQRQHKRARLSHDGHSTMIAEPRRLLPPLQELLDSLSRREIPRASEIYMFDKGKKAGKRQRE